MEDERIVELYWERSETAISETDAKYGGYCRRVAYNILGSLEDSRECVNDTWLRAWESMPPKRPSVLRTFLGKITRNLSLDRYDMASAEKRGAGQTALALDELSECVPSGASDIGEEIAITDALDRFLASLPAERRRIFVRRYWYLDSVKDISSAYKMGESRVKTSLMRTRNELRAFLEKEGISI